MTTDIYKQFDAAFARVEAHVILRDGKRVGTVAIKFPADGAGRLYAYVHWHGLEMVRGSASGYGYDKRSAACSAAGDKLPAHISAHDIERIGAGYAAFREAMRKDNGKTWHDALRDAGFEVMQAV